MQRFLKLFAIIVLLGVAILPTSPLVHNVYAATTTYRPSPFNGFAVYLSPANQPANIGCDGYSETDGARAMARAAKDALFSWGYLVYVGDGVVNDNIADSNRLRPNLHVAIHSNAGTQDCAGANAANGGTWVVYRQFDASGIRATDRIYPQLQPWSPGTSDRKGTDKDVIGFVIAETQNTQAPTSFVETAFHTYGPDEDWLRNSAAQGRKIATGIDNYFGNPRCGVTKPCPTRIAQVEPQEVLPPPPLITPPSNLRGRSHAEARTEMEKLLRGPTTTARSNGEDSWFSEKTAGMLKDVTMNKDGVVVVNVADWSKVIPNASTSAGAHILMHELNETIFQFPEAKSVVYQFEGSCDAFWNFLQAPCQLITREAWEDHTIRDEEPQ